MKDGNVFRDDVTKAEKLNKFCIRLHKKELSSTLTMAGTSYPDSEISVAGVAHLLATLTPCS